MTDSKPKADGPAQGSRASADTAELNRLSVKLERLSAQSKALRKAMLQFGENFDETVGATAFSSPDSDDINRVYTVTGGYLALVNKHGRDDKGRRKTDRNQADRKYARNYGNRRCNSGGRRLHTSTGGDLRSAVPHP